MQGNNVHVTKTSSGHYRVNFSICLLSVSPIDVKPVKTFQYHHIQLVLL